MDNLAEYIAGTQSDDPESRFRIELTLSEGIPGVVVETIAIDGPGYQGLNRLYSIDVAPSLGGSAFTAHPEANRRPATGFSLVIANDVPAFFRARVELTGP